MLYNYGLQKVTNVELTPKSKWDSRFLKKSNCLLSCIYSVTYVGLNTFFMKILFLCSGGNSCRSLIAKTIMESFDSGIEVYSAGMRPIAELNQLAFDVMSGFGMDMIKDGIQIIAEHQNIEFDYVITVGEGTQEEYGSLPLNYKRKLHLGFVDPEKEIGTEAEQHTAYCHFIDEVKTELDYFYHRILKRKVVD